jgi:DNA-binding winged helix-turn-helix (wHTH) protein
MAVQNLKSLSFGPFTLDPEGQSLSRAGKEVPLSVPAFKVLRVLVQKRGQWLQKAEIASEAGLSSKSDRSLGRLTVVYKYIGEIEMALGDLASIYLEARHGRGCRLKPEEPVAIARLVEELKSLCGRPEEVDEVCSITGHSAGVAIDSAFEIHSKYAGWSLDDMEIHHKRQSILLPPDLRDLVRADPHPPRPPNNKKYRLCGLELDSTEGEPLRLTFAPTDFFSTDAIERLNREQWLRDSEGHKVSTLAKYGTDLLDFKKSKIPHKVGVECTAVLKDEKLLLGRRTEEVRNEKGKWSLSFEENMNADPTVRKRDWDLFDAVIAGVDEELGITDWPASHIRILSLMMHAGALAVFATGLVYMPTMTLEEIRARWNVRLSRDGKKEFKEFSEIEWTIEALAPMLAQEKTLLSSGIEISPEKWHWTARSRALLVLFHKFGVVQTLTGLSARKNDRVK